MFTKDWEPIKRYILAIDNHWKRAKNKKLVFDYYARKEVKIYIFFQIPGNCNLFFLFFSEEMFLFLVCSICTFLCKWFNRTHDPNYTSITHLGVYFHGRNLQSGKVWEDEKVTGWVRMASEPNKNAVYSAYPIKNRYRWLRESSL